jgi:hypothetical protein
MQDIFYFTVLVGDIDINKAYVVYSLTWCWAWPEEMSNHIQALHSFYAPALKKYFGFSSLSTSDMKKLIEEVVWHDLGHDLKQF